MLAQPSKYVFPRAVAHNANALKLCKRRHPPRRHEFAEHVVCAGIATYSPLLRGSIHCPLAHRQLPDSMISQSLQRFARLPLFNAPTALEKLPRLSATLGRDIYLKRDDTTQFALGGNKVRKLEYLLADALQQGADTLITAGAIQSNHVRQTAAAAARLGLGCLA